MNRACGYFSETSMRLVRQSIVWQGRHSWQTTKLEDEYAVSEKYPHTLFTFSPSRKRPPRAALCETFNIWKCPHEHSLNQCIIIGPDNQQVVHRLRSGLHIYFFPACISFMADSIWVFSSGLSFSKARSVSIAAQD